MKSIANSRVLPKQQLMLMFILILLSLSGCENKSMDKGVSQVNSPVVAVVSGKEIHDIDIDYEILSMPESMRHLMQDEEARAKILHVMIQREAVAQKAKAMGLDRDPLVQHRIHQAQNSVLIQSIRDWQQQDVAVFNDAQIQAYYDKHMDDFKIPEQIHVRHILLSDKQKALEVLKMLKRKPDSFSALAAQFSIDDSNKGRGGDLNWFARGTMVKPFEDVAFALSEKRRISQPVKTKFGWHIIEWLGKKEGNTPSVDDVKDEVTSILRKKALDTWIKQLMDEADISVLKAEYQIKK
ncbi:peptidylprolyl isomerase [Ghiorsea bivora]|uniref:peptidylprolyl isomerase n=1 Tax=Ghiorsea bivora TaxID=1485545 RepID=UPI00056EF8A9|nr:peptidylprolyl isomerase [Ghiorsea bivora]